MEQTLAIFLFSSALVFAAESPRTLDSISTNSTASSQLLPAAEAKQALERAQDSKVPAGTGTWRYVQIVEYNGQNSGTNPVYFTNIFFAWHGPDKRELRRTEQFDSSSTNSRPRVWVHNDEGSWALHDNLSILFPPSRAKARRDTVKTAGGTYEWHLTPVPIGLDDADPELTGDIEITGERFQQGGRWFLRITKRYGEKSRSKLTQMLKKRMPIFFRPFFKTVELRKLVDETMAVRYEWVLDPETWTFLISREFRADGQLLFEGQGWQPWTNLPPEEYAIPKDIPRIHPKSLDEANRLDGRISPHE